MSVNVRVCVRAYVSGGAGVSLFVFDDVCVHMCLR